MPLRFSPDGSAPLITRKEPTKQVKDIERNQGVESESAILVGVFLSDQPNDDVILEELAGLAETAGAEVVGRLTQRRETPDVTTYLGKGKVEELEKMVKATDATS